MPTTEPTINDALAEVLEETRRAWHQTDVVRSENTRMLKGSNERPDILVTESNVSPVVIETEVLPASTVESDATSRLGKQIRRTGKTILSSIAVRLPERLTTKQGSSLRSELENASDIEMALYTGSDPSDTFSLATFWLDFWAVSLISQFLYSMRQFHLKLLKQLQIS